MTIYGINLDFTTKLTIFTTWIMDSTKFNNFFKLFLFNDMIIKIDTCKIKHQLNTKIFF